MYLNIYHLTFNSILIKINFIKNQIPSRNIKHTRNSGHNQFNVRRVKLVFNHHR